MLRPYNSRDAQTRSLATPLVRGKREHAARARQPEIERRRDGLEHVQRGLLARRRHDAAVADDTRLKAHLDVVPAAETPRGLVERRAAEDQLPLGPGEIVLERNSTRELHASVVGDAHALAATENHR